MKRRILILIAGLAVVIAGIYYWATRRPAHLILTGIVTTDSVVVSSEIQGRLQELLVKEGDVVKRGQLLGRIQPQEWKADRDFYANTEKQSASQVAQAEADFKYQESVTSNQIWQAEANLAAAEAQVVQAQADLENAQLTYERENRLHQGGVESAQAYDQSRTAADAAKARVDSTRKQAVAARAAVELAKSNSEQVAARHAALEANVHQLAAAGAQTERASVILGYTDIHAPIDGIVDIRAALQGEVVNLGQGIVTLINQDNLWVRADVEETYIDSVRLGDKLMVRLPSGVEREGEVFFRGVDADYATQRDVSRTKRDIKTFEIRLHVDNSDRSLAVGMTAYVTLPLGKRPPGKP
jgi:HlyD family secretion protein